MRKIGISLFNRKGIILGCINNFQLWINPFSEYHINPLPYLNLILNPFWMRWLCGQSKLSVAIYLCVSWSPNHKPQYPLQCKWLIGVDMLFRALSDCWFSNIVTAILDYSLFLLTSLLHFCISLVHWNMASFLHWSFYNYRSSSYPNSYSYRS